MFRLTNGQRTALEALSRAIMPAAFENALTRDLPHQVETRIATLGSYDQRRAARALSLFDSRYLSFLLLGRPTTFAKLEAGARDRMLRRCGMHRLAVVRALFQSMRRLILHTHYSRPAAGAEVGHLGPIHERPTLLAWEGPQADGAPVVSRVLRDIVRERSVPAGVIVLGRAPAPDIRARVCIVGSGVGGATAAAVLAQAGHDIVVLEDGDYQTAADFGDDEAVAMRTLYADGALRSTDDLNVSILQARCAGGGSTVNWMVMLRTPERVIDEWRISHHTENMSVPEMTAAFERFESDNNVRLVPDGAHSPANRIILDGAKKLGWSAHPASINARDCMRSGACGLGCRYDAKQGMMLTQLPRALAAGARLYCNARVRRVARRGAGFRVHASLLNVDCDVVIIAAGATETPALLERSGLACPGVGQNLRLHPTTAVIGVYDEPVYAAGGIPLTSYCDEFTDLRDGYGHWIETPPFTAGLAAVMLPDFGAVHRGYMRQFPHLAPLIVLVRDGAPTGPSVGTVRARDGVRLSYRLGTTDRAAMLHGMESAARIHFASGARSVVTLLGGENVLHSERDLPLIRLASARYGDPSLFSAHVNGTARIGSDPRTSGCRPDGQVHGQPGLYVMDGSLMPTAPGVNPHETIAAVASILAECLTARLALFR